MTVMRRSDLGGFSGMITPSSMNPPSRPMDDIRSKIDMMRRPMPTFQGPINTGARGTTFMNRMKQGMPGMLSNFGEMMRNRQPQMQQQMPMNPAMGGFQRAFSRAMPDREMMMNRRSQFMY